MSIKTYCVQDFLKSPGVFCDVRSPIEYEHAHIPNAYNLPLFTDDERARVGTTYKKVGRQEAIDLGVELVGPRLSEYAKSAKSISKNLPDASVLKIYCARGGMRSQFLAWFLQFIGNKVITLQGGYKAYRRHVLEVLSNSSHKFIVLGGMTGLGKTKLLSELQKRDEQVLDLECLAKHKGSAFGYDPNVVQPSPEYFENLLACELSALLCNKVTWIEDESRLIGRCVVPNKVFESMKVSPIIVLKTTIEERISRIREEYADYSKEWWIHSTSCIKKRLGGALTQKIIASIELGYFESAISDLLGYYDASYEYSMRRHSGKIITLDVSKLSFNERIQLLQEVKNRETAKI